MIGRSTLEIKELSLVLVGKFNPVIFHPQWLLRKELIGEGLAATADLKISHAEVSEFDLDYCAIQVFPDRFSATSTQETHFEAMRDLVINIFECLPESPIVQMGINLHHHYRFDNKEDYNNFGHKIVPKAELWKRHFPNPGLSKIQIEGERNDKHSGKKVVILEMSNRIKGLGIKIQLNDHFDLYEKNEKERADASRALTVLKGNYNQSLGSAIKIILGVYEYGIKR